MDYSVRTSEVMTLGGCVSICIVPSSKTDSVYFYVPVPRYEDLKGTEYRIFDFVVRKCDGYGFFLKM